MTTTRSVPTDVRYVLTEAGSIDLHEAETCRCDVRLTGVLLTCAGCGTVYGSIRETRFVGFERKSRGRS